MYIKIYMNMIMIEYVRAVDVGEDGAGVLFYILFVYQL